MVQMQLHVKALLLIIQNKFRKHAFKNYFAASKDDHNDKTCISGGTTTFSSAHKEHTQTEYLQVCVNPWVAQYTGGRPE